MILIFDIIFLTFLSGTLDRYNFNIKIKVTLGIYFSE